MPATQRHVLVLEFSQRDEWKVNTHLTVVEPAILKAVEGVEQRHVEEANHLSNGIDGKKTNYHTLKDHKETHRNVQRRVGGTGESAFTQMSSFSVLCTLSCFGHSRMKTFRRWLLRLL